MGISVSIIPVTDRQIRDFVEHPSRAEDMCNSIIPFGGKDECLRLFNDWRRIHAFLLGWRGEDLPFSCLQRGDVRFSPVGDATWAIYSASVQSLSRDLAGLDKSRIGAITVGMGAAYMSDIAERKKRGATSLEDTTPEKAWAQELSTLIGYVLKLQDFAARAAEARKGFMVCRYEDW